MGDFRSEVFGICKKLQHDEIAKGVRNVIYSLSVRVENDGKEITPRLHYDFSDVAKHYNAEFYGYLFVDDYLEQLGLPQPIKLENLEEEERRLLELGHRTLLQFVDLCLDEIRQDSEIVYQMMNPYSYFKFVRYNSANTGLLSEDDMQEAVKAFKNGTIYHGLIKSNIANISKLFDATPAKDIVLKLENEFDNWFTDNVSNGLNEFALKLMQRSTEISNIVMTYTIPILALKRSLGLACRLLFRAICGIGLTVLNNNNIIKISDNKQDHIGEFYKILTQAVSITDFTDSIIGGVILIDCDTANGHHIHEFGKVVATTISFGSELGNTTKYSISTINEEMVDIHNMTNLILQTGLPDFNC